MMDVAIPEHVFIVSDASTTERKNRLSDFREAINSIDGDFEVHELIDLPMMELIDADC